ncbi:MAG: hydrogenase maturation nickel metallochaperone HypA [Armatimonadota bacterium]
MHDVTAAQSIAHAVLEAARGRSVTRVEQIRLTLGAMTMLDAEQLEFWLQQMLRGTIADGARIDIQQLPLTVRCPACGFEGELPVPDDPIYHLMPYVPACPRCDAEELEVVGGGECVVESIRVQTAEGDSGHDG